MPHGYLNLAHSRIMGTWHDNVPQLPLSNVIFQVPHPRIAFISKVQRVNVTILLAASDDNRDLQFWVFELPLTEAPIAKIGDSLSREKLGMLALALILNLRLVP
jgi:hypothetical protein